MDLENINIMDDELTGEEIGQLLLTAVKQVKAGKFGHVRQVVLNEAIEARKRTGLSQSEFAQIMGISVRTLQGWEQGRRMPSGPAATLLKIASRHPETLIELRT